MSIVSGESRLSRLSRRSSSRRVVSTAEREQAEMELGRLELAALMRHNEQAYKHAIHYPDLRRGHHSLELTVPKEFHLSSSLRPVLRGDGSAASEPAAELCVEWPSVLRRSVSRERSGTPELTVPKAPALRTASRSASRSGSRHRSISRHSLPREQAAIERHFQRTAPAVASAEERAERARAAAQAKQDEAVIEEKKRLCVFRPAKSQTLKGPGKSMTSGNKSVNSVEAAPVTSETVEEPVSAPTEIEI